MQIKLLVSAFMITLICNTANAHHIQNGQMSGHKEWASPGVSGQSKLVPMKTIANKLKKIDISTKLSSDVDDYNELIIPSTTLDSKVTHLGEQDLSGTAIVTISNLTESTQSYTIYSKLCLLTYLMETGLFDDEACFNVEDTITLNNHGKIDYAVNPRLTHQFMISNAIYFFRLVLDVKNNNTKTLVRSVALDRTEENQLS